MDHLVRFHITTALDMDFDKSVHLSNKHNLKLEVSQFTVPDAIEGDIYEHIDIFVNKINPQNRDVFTSHGAFFDLCPTSLDNAVVELTTKRILDSIRISEYLGADTVVFHSGYNNNVKAEAYKAKFIEKQIEFWNPIVKTIENSNITIALENTFEETPSIMKEILEGVSSPSFKTCIDTGHVNCYTNYDLIHWVYELEDYLHHFHLHNNNGQRDEHRTLTRGTINFKSFFEEMKFLNKPVIMTLEVFTETDMIDSINYIQSL